MAAVAGLRPLTGGSCHWRRFRPADHRNMPWKNGLGTTAEIAIDPPGADIAGGRFRWRLSIASIDRSCPFSAFPGYERTIMVISGNGMVLTVAGRPARRMDRLFDPFMFSGDEPADCQLIDGPIRDFNLVVDRARSGARTAVEVLGPTPRERQLGGEVCLVHCLSGEAMVGVGAREPTERLELGDTLLVRTGELDRDSRTLSLIGVKNAVATVIELHNH
ncbi:MAG: HutD/Ves family protein [Dongiaceae bacterium]